jgi:hypothetical protein
LSLFISTRTKLSHHKPIPSGLAASKDNKPPHSLHLEGYKSVQGPTAHSLTSQNGRIRKEVYLQFLIILPKSYTAMSWPALYFCQVPLSPDCPVSTISPGHLARMENAEKLTSKNGHGPARGKIERLPSDPASSPSPLQICLHLSGKGINPTNTGQIPRCCAGLCSSQRKMNRNPARLVQTPP